ncbi:FAD dependent oxidoreductase [Phlebopus sp. FC_14]|nr:FAD dependent oxidoreductase [Phlebopus sp. FC_14]
MGNAISLFHLALADFLDSLRTFQSLKERLHHSPGLPLDNPSRSFWMYPPSSIAQHCSPLPHYADFVVIGSGITGTSVARTLLDRCHAEKIATKLVMLEARDACSGATGRNGGHISPPLYHDYATLARDHGSPSAQKMIRFRLAHLHELRRVAEEESILEESQWREVEAVDAFYNRELFEKAKEKVLRYQRDLPFEASHHRVCESEEAVQTYHLASDAVGCIASGAGAIHPYRFVTGILSNLLSRYADNFFLCTNTPCTMVSGPSSSTPLYTITTPKGTIQTPHVIHATNGWCSHLLEPMRAKVVPFCGNMSAQRPGQSLPPSTINRSFIFYASPIGYDYLTQLPNGERELMLGGGFAQQGNEGYEAMGNTDDRVHNKRVGAHLAGVLPRYFGEENWGAEGQPLQPSEGRQGNDPEWFRGRVKALWSGVLGISVDLLPWVGRLPSSVSGRSEPLISSSPRIGKEDEMPLGAPPGEWIAAGYSGEGMVHAWLSGKALAEMLLGRENEASLAEWFPDIMRVTTGRWKKAKPENLLDMFKD